MGKIAKRFSDLAARMDAVAEHYGDVPREERPTKELRDVAFYWGEMENQSSVKDRLVTSIFLEAALDRVEAHMSTGRA